MSHIIFLSNPSQYIYKSTVIPVVHKISYICLYWSREEKI